MEDGRKTKAIFPIGLKLVIIFSALIVIVLCVTTFMVSTLVRNDEQIKAEETNHTINGRTAVAVETVFDAREKAAWNYYDMVVRSDESGLSSLFTDFCLENQDTVFMWNTVYGLQVNSLFTVRHAGAKTVVSDWLSEKRADILKAVLKGGNRVVYNLSPLFNTPILCIAFPYSVSDTASCSIIAFDASSLLETLATGSYNSSFLMNSDGDVLIHSDLEKTSADMNLASLETVRAILESPTDNGQLLGTGEDGDNYFYAFHKLEKTGVYAVTTEAQSVVFETINRTTYRIILISVATWFLAVLLIRLFSKTITWPVHTLVEASHRIEQGDFLLDIKPASHDELGVLTDSFVQMGRGLAERERLKTTFSKFTNKTVAERAMNGELVLGGETRQATIFFSDIRNFTAMSEKMQPSEVVEFLNEYMTSMVDCVTKTGGVVDKFIGDAIMAVWGAPESSGSAARDALSCVLAALMMRNRLLVFNEGRGGPGKPILRIGCGINTGDVVAGQIGSSERMEYTVIGDAVNLASRTEGLNKPFHTDILITENTYRLIKDYVIVEEMPSVSVKGKSEPVKIYAVINKVGARGPQSLAKVRSLLNTEAPDLSKVDTNEEEKKYKIN